MTAIAPTVGLAADRHAIDVVALERYLAATLVGYAAPLAVQRLKGGASNPTYVMTCGNGDAPRRFILRKKPAGILLPSAHQIEREYRAMAALVGTAVPVPQVRLLCEDAAVVGTPFYVMDFLDGRIFQDITLPGLAAADRTQIYTSFIEVMARLHAVDVKAVGLADFGRPDGFFERQIKRWTQQYRAAETETIPAMERLIVELPAQIPAAGPTTIAHGDFRLENLMFHPTEPRAIALLDWELATLGSPLADLGYACIAYHIDLRWFGSLVGVDFAATGLLDQDTLVARYCEFTGRQTVSRLNFYIAFGLFRLAAIAQGVFKRELDGVGTGHEAGSMNEAPAIAASGVNLLEQDLADPTAVTHATGSDA